jgi:hypothetical protein
MAHRWGSPRPTARQQVECFFGGDLDLLALHHSFVGRDVCAADQDLVG